MKTLKLTLVATIVAFALVSAANADGGFKLKPRFTKAVELTIENAVKNPGLVAAMYNQIDPALVLNFPLPPIIVDVKYNNAVYRISGTRLEWLKFFKMRGTMPCEKKLQKAIW